MTTEEWRSVTGFEGFYEVSSLGSIRGVDRIIDSGKGYTKPLRGRILRAGTSKRGYSTVVLSRDGVGKTFSVHRIVAKAFLKNEPSKTEVNHIDSVRNNNRASNLEWTTKIDNVIHSYLYGEASKRRKLRDDQVLMIIELGNWSKKQQKKSKTRAFDNVWLARCFKTNKSTIRSILTNKSYIHKKINAQDQMTCSVYEYLQENKE